MNAPLPQRQRPQPSPTVIYDQLVSDFQAGLVPVDYRMPAPLDTSQPLEDTEQGTSSPTMTSPLTPHQ